MKIAIINDVHIGARSDSERIANFQDQFFREILLQGAKDGKYDKLYILGDLFERRKFINFRSLDNAAENLFGPLEDLNVPVVVTSGNHDVYYRNTNRVNSVKLLLRGYKNIEKIVDLQPHEVTEGSASILLMPWITEDNKKRCIDKIKKSSSKYCFGHFDINGFEMTPGHYCDSGLDRKLFWKFDKVLSGHYHLKSNQGNITYLGTQYEMDWGDHGQTKGYHIFDTETGDLEFVKNPNSIFIKILYTEGKMESKKFDVAGKYVKVLVMKRENAYKFDKWLDGLMKQNPEDLQVVEQQMIIENQEELDGEISHKSTLDILLDHVDSLEGISKNSVKSTKTFLKELFTEAQSSVEV